MPKKVYLIENLDCANCAAKIEAKFNAHKKVQEVTITFSTRQLRLTADDPDSLIPELTDLARTVEHNVLILPREQAHQEHHAHSCSCGHDREHHGHGCSCGHDHEHHDHGCSCGHDHEHHDHGCACGHDHEHHDHSHHDHSEKDEKKQLLWGIWCFVAALLLKQVDVLSAVSFAAPDTPASVK